MKPAPVTPTVFASHGPSSWLLALCLASAGGLATAQPANLPPTVASSSKEAEQARTSDGREFSKLTEAEVDGLPRSEAKRYYFWKNAELDKRLARVKEELTIIEERLEASSLALGMKASQAIPPLLAQAQRGEKVSISQDLKDVIQRIADGSLPPANMKVDASRLMQYLNGSTAPNTRRDASKP